MPKRDIFQKNLYFGYPKTCFFFKRYFLFSLEHYGQDTCRFPDSIFHDYVPYDFRVWF